MLSALLRTAFALFTLLVVLAPPRAAAAGLSESYGRLPLHFEENRGQVDPQVRFLARGPGYGLYLTAGEAVLALGAKDRTVLRMALVGANADAQASGVEELPGKVNYFVGKDSAKWRTNVPTYGKVRYREVYKGIDLVYYGNQRQLEYDFVVAPGADPEKILLRFEGADAIKIDAQGNLVLYTANGELRQHKPVVYQEVEGVRQEIEGGYVIKDAHRVGFKVAAYDANQPLVIDPVLAYATYLGGSRRDLGVGVAVDAAGNAYVVGETGSVDFPTTIGAHQMIYGGTGGPFSTGDAFVTKLNSAGTALVYSTYLGGTLRDNGSAIAVDAGGNAYVTGSTESYDFPVTASAFQQTRMSMTDAFVAKLGPTGSTLAYSTFLGGNNLDQAYAIAVDTAGNAYITGNTDSVDFPTTALAFQPRHAGADFSGDAFVTKLNSAGSALAYSTYLGGSGEDDWGQGIAVDAGGNAYVVGSTPSTDFPTTPGALQPDSTQGGGFVTKFDPAGSALVYSTYLTAGGTAVAVDASGSAYVTGSGAFVAKLNAAGSAFVYSTLLGGPGGAVGRGIAVDAAGRAHVTGDAYMVCGPSSSCVTGFPTTPGAFQPEHGGAASDAFVSTLNPMGSALVYSTYVGGSGADGGLGIAVDSSGGTYITGWTNSGNFPVTIGSFQQVSGGDDDGFVAKFQIDGPTVTRFEEDSATYRGYWPTYGPETGTFSAGTIRASNQSTATATFTFTGTAVSWIGVKCNACGIATVQIDGGAPTVVDTFGPGEPGSLTSEPVFTASGLAPGATHTLTIVVTGGGAAIPGSLTGSAHVAVDAFDVTN